jgi:hypothetical protein
MSPTPHDHVAIVWRRVDMPGHEAAELHRVGDAWELSGVAVLTDAGRPCRLDYVIECGGDWATRRCEVRGYVGADRAHMVVVRDEAGSWAVNHEPAASLDGCIDVDLGFSPSTNLLPIRRLALAVGASASVRAAWIRFPQLTVEVLEQTYTRTAPETYKYESAGGAFRRDLAVNADGLVVDYPGLWIAEGSWSGGTVGAETRRRT